tara:strand:+ start:138 stop:3440 length:3303 start_codon:yes stop_codon:yes gene_type:complete
MRYNTGNPIDSDSPKDFSDNSKNLDQALNSTESTWSDRFGVERPTLPKLIDEFPNAFDDAARAEAARDEAEAAADGVSASAAAALASETNAATSEVNAETAVTNAESAQAGAESARDAALLSRGLWQNTAQGIGNGVAGTASLVAGSGGTNGTFALAFSGGTQVIAPKGYFVVAGGVVTQVVITYAGHYSAGVPSLSFAASAGLTGASATAVMGANTPVDAYFSVPVAGSNDSLILYKVTTGPAATEITRYASSNAVLKPTYAGKYNGWEDPFFRRTGINEVVRNRGRYYAGGKPITSLEFSTSTPFNGRALRKNSSGTGNLAGPRIYLDEIGATAGDTITIRALIVGDGASVIFPSRGVSASGASIGTQFTSTPSSITASSTPTLVTATIATEALTQSVWLYPYTNTAGKTFDIVALWVYKGVAADGPSWPLFGEDAYLLNKVVESDDALATLEDEVDLNTTKLAGLSSEATVVTAASTAVNLTVTSPVLDFQYGSPFSGWGEAYTPAGIDFNAVRVRYLARKEADTTLAQQWSYLHVVVRTGANAHLASAPVVAVGVVKIPAAKASLANITILLRDPVTNALITLNDASFSGGEYFVGVYARTLSGAPASMSFHRAAQANSKGQSYYITTANPLTGLWNVNSNNVRVGVDHLLMVSPVESLVYTLNQTVIADAFASLPVSAPEMVMPPTIYGVQGRECNVYLDNLHLGNSSDYLHDVTSVSALGQQQNERWTWIPTAALASGSLSVSANDKRTGTALVTKSAQQRAAASTAGSGLTKKVMVIGDSLINAGTITQTLLDNAGSDVMGVTLIGARGTGPNLHEGRGGWTVNDYATAGRTYFKFTVSGVTVAPAINSTTYTNNGNTYTVQEYDLTAGAGTYICSVSPLDAAPTASGTLTKASGVGDATVTFSASEALSGNPFWIGGGVDFGQYLTNNGFAAPDVVFIGLGINDCFGQTSDTAASDTADVAFAKLDALIASIKTADAGTKVGIMIPSPPSSDQDSFGANYTTGQTRWRFKRNILIWARQLIAKYSGQEASRIYIVPSNVALDTVNNMNRASAAPVNSRSAITVQRQNNGVHPESTGYQQIGDALWAFLKFYA